MNGIVLLMIGILIGVPVGMAIVAFMIGTSNQSTAKQEDHKWH